MHIFDRSRIAARRSLTKFAIMIQILGFVEELQLAQDLFFSKNSSPPVEFFYNFLCGKSPELKPLAKNPHRKRFSSTEMAKLSQVGKDLGAALVKALLGEDSDHCVESWKASGLQIAPLNSYPWSFSHVIMNIENSETGTSTSVDPSIAHLEQLASQATSNMHMKSLLEQHHPQKKPRRFLNNDECSILLQLHERLSNDKKAISRAASSVPNGITSGSGWQSKLSQRFDVSICTKPSKSSKKLLLSEEDGKAFASKSDRFSEAQINAINSIVTAQSDGYKHVILNAVPAGSKTECLTYAITLLTLMHGPDAILKPHFLQTFTKAAVLEMESRLASANLDKSAVAMSRLHNYKSRGTQIYNLHRAQTNCQIAVGQFFRHIGFKEEFKIETFDETFQDDDEELLFEQSLGPSSGEEEEEEDEEDEDSAKNKKEEEEERDDAFADAQAANNNRESRLCQARNVIRKHFPEWERLSAPLMEFLPMELREKLRNIPKNDASCLDEIGWLCETIIRDEAALGTLDPVDASKLKEEYGNWRSRSLTNKTHLDLAKAVCKIAMESLDSDSDSETESNKPNKPNKHKKPDNSSLSVPHMAKKMNAVHEAALLQVSNGDEVVHSFPFDPQYEEYVNEEMAKDCGMSLKKLLEVMRAWDKHLIDKRRVTFSMIQFAVYRTVLRKSGFSDGKLTRSIDEAQTCSRSIIESHIALADEQSYKGISILAGQPEQDLMGYAGGCGDFVSLVSDIVENPMTVLHIRLCVNFATPNTHIVGIYNLLAPACGTPDPIMMLPRPGAAAGAQVRIVVNRFDPTRVRKQKQIRKRKRPEGPPSQVVTGRSNRDLFAKMEDEQAQNPQTKTYVTIRTKYADQVFLHLADEMLVLAKSQSERIKSVQVLSRINMKRTRMLFILKKVFQSQEAMNLLPDEINLSTVHRSLGTRADHVFVIGFANTHFFHDPAQEFRILMVAGSRPRHTLSILYAEKPPPIPTGNGGKGDKGGKGGKAKISTLMAPFQLENAFTKLLESASKPDQPDCFQLVEGNVSHLIPLISPDVSAPDVVGQAKQPEQAETADAIQLAIQANFHEFSETPPTAE